MKTIAIYHNKGGVGKTTTAVNLAAAFQNKGKRVLLIDIDSQANATFSTGLIKFQFEEDDDLINNNISHLVGSGEFNFIPEIVRKSNGFNIPEIDVIPRQF
jgi:cellulose biosynthesis protein BcsQ